MPRKIFQNIIINFGKIYKKSFSKNIWPKFLATFSRKNALYLNFQFSEIRERKSCQPILMKFIPKSNLIMTYYNLPLFQKNMISNGLYSKFLCFFKETSYWKYFQPSSGALNLDLQNEQRSTSLRNLHRRVQQLTYQLLI